MNTPNLSRIEQQNETRVGLGDESKYVFISHKRYRLCFDVTSTHLDLRIYADDTDQVGPTHHVKVNLESGESHVVEPLEVIR